MGLKQLGAIKEGGGVREKGGETIFRKRRRLKSHISRKESEKSPSTQRHLVLKKTIFL